MATFQDKTLTCADCGASFTFTTGEQEFYADKGFTNEPRRCPDCRKNKKNERRKEQFKAVCAECGGEALLPFQPRDERPVFCSDCFAKQREQH